MIHRHALVLALGLAAACMGGKDEAQRETAAASPDKAEAWDGDDWAADEPEPAMAPDEGRTGRGEEQSARPRRAAPAAPPALGGAPRDEAGPQTRAWFPETFLFEPVVVTDRRGAAEVTVRVPDRLTTWRVLALAHSRSGAQAGAVARFDGTLPVYVEPVVPARLRAGDRVELPILVVNTTSEPVTARLEVRATGATLAGASGTVTVPPGGSVVRRATLTAPRPGTAQVRAAIGVADAIVREIEVAPTGKREDLHRSGTLAAPRTLALPGLAPDTYRVTLQVFPGALALLRSELSVAVGRGGLAEDAFAMLLAGRAPELLRALGDEPDAEALRRLVILTTQRVVRHARRLDTRSASLLAEAARAHPDSPVLAGIGRRALATLVDSQSPDGTCGGETGWTLQRLLVATADCARAAQTEPTVVIRASAAFERNAAHIDDAYTAAAVLASGAAGATLTEALRETVRGAITRREDGAAVLAVADGVVRADGVRPSVPEATALAVLALAGDPDAPLADMGAAILAAYSPARGWGDGRANLVCMQAMLALFAEPVPANTQVVLRKGGEEIARGELSRQRVREVSTLVAEELTLSGEADFALEAIPPVPGLGYSFTLTRWGPWPATEADRGLAIQTVAPRAPVVGQPAELLIRVTAPSGRALRTRHALPAGVQVDTDHLDQLVADGTLSRYEHAEGTLELFAPPLEPAQLFSVTLRVIPTLAGTLQSGPSSVTLDRTEVLEPPTPWRIAPN